jgi:hypothetical protein
VGRLGRRDPPVHAPLISLGYQNFVGPTAPPPMDDRSALAMMSAVIIVLTAAFYYYAHRQRKAGVLR